MSALAILIADDHALVRRGLRAVIEDHPGWTVCGEAATGLEAVDLATAARPDIVVMDISMPGLNGLEATRRIRQTLPATEVLILTMHESETLTQEIVAVGARGLVLKSDASRLLVTALESLAAGTPFFSGAAAELLLRGIAPSDSTPAGRAAAALTRREREVLGLVAQGRSNKAVAADLAISAKTVEAHVGAVLRKLQLSNRHELGRWAMQRKLD